MSSQLPLAEFTAEMRNEILDLSFGVQDLPFGRLPLHIDFDSNRSDVPFDSEPADINDHERFNAVGSLTAMYANFRDHNPQDQMHKPVLDIDRQISSSTFAGVTKVVIELAASRHGLYKPGSWLRPLFGMLEVEVEVFTSQSLRSANFGTSLDCSEVQALTLTADASLNRLGLLPSSTPGHGHLYINNCRGLTWQEYQELLGGLEEAGVVDASWVEQSNDQGMTIVRTPWNRAPVPRAGS